MTYFRNVSGVETKKKFYKKMWFKIVAPIVLILVIVGGAFAWKTGSILSKISSGGLLNSIAHAVPGAQNQLKGEADGRINILLLGMRGANDPAGGTLSDTIQVLSIAPKENKVALMSIPRDLYVDNPALGNKSKINAVHAYGEQKGAGQGMTYMEQVVGDVTGIPIHYAVTANFEAFNQLITALGGVTVTLDQPFEESQQFNQPHVCDGNTFTKPTGKFEYKYHHYSTSRKIVAQYPLCTNSSPECGGDFKLAAGVQNLNAAQALCFARSRETSNDFARAKRQQQVLQAIKDKLLSVGTLTDFGKMNGVLNSLGDNVKTDMQPWEMKRLYDLYNQMKGYTMYNRVIDSTDNPDTGLVYGVADPVAGDILLPKGDNFDQIRAMFKNIFTLTPQPKQ
jgi:polyisoprenyl-teichoic acid--peptidoglycan teichoic acid transferase